MAPDRRLVGTAGVYCLKRGGAKKGGGGALFPIVPLHAAPCGAVSGSRAADLGTPCGAAPDSGQDVSLLLLVPSFSFFFPMSVCLFLFFSSFFPRLAQPRGGPIRPSQHSSLSPLSFFVVLGLGYKYGRAVAASCAVKNIIFFTGHRNAKGHGKRR